jgi:hypothetical protein
MKVLHLEEGCKYYVWAMCGEDGSCQVMEELRRVRAEHPDLVDTILALLLEITPNEGPPLDDPYRAKMLYRDRLYELKADKEIARRKRLGLRIAFFFDNYHGGPVVICTNAFCKTGSTPQECLDLAETERARYYGEKDDLEFVTEAPL